MALLFGAVNTDTVTHTAGTVSLNNLAAFTWLLWLRRTTLTSNRVILSKGSAAKRIRLNGTAGNVELNIARATTNSSFITSTTPLSGTGWVCLATTYDSAAGAGTLGHIYVGSLTARMVEATLGTNTDGSGAVNADNTVQLIACNQSAGTVAFQGALAVVAVWNRVLTLAEIQQQQFMLRKTSGCLGLFNYGFNGTSTQIDRSGNKANGTVSGPTVVPHVPLSMQFGKDLSVPYAIAAAQATPELQRDRHHQLRQLLAQ